MVRTGMVLLLLGALWGCSGDDEGETAQEVYDGTSGSLAGSLSGTAGAGGLGAVNTAGNTITTPETFSGTPMGGYMDTSTIGTGGTAGTTAVATMPTTPMGTGGGMGTGTGTGMGTGTVDGTPVEGGASDPVIPEVTGECPSFTDGTITYGGVGGIRMAAGPKASSPSAPMVIYWHGTGSNAGEYALMAGAVHQGVVSEGGVLISFNGSSGQGDSSCSGTFIFSLGDMDIVDQLVACAVRDHNVDPRRIHVTGCSAGGLFSACMAARRSEYVASVAPNSGGFAIPQPFSTNYTPPLMTVHGENDVVIVNFKDTSATADMIFKDRGTFVVNCNHGGGHCGGGGLAPDIWEFFKAHPYGVDPYPWASGLPAGFNSKCMIY